MDFIKIGKQIGGIRMNVNEQRAFNEEIKKAVAEHYRKIRLETVSLILWQLHEEFGFGPERLKRYFLNFDRNTKAMVEHYELEDADDNDIWLATRKLKEYGVDLDAWEKELEEGN